MSNMTNNNEYANAINCGGNIPCMATNEFIIHEKYRDIGSINDRPKVCTCDIMKLMSVGCKCGQMERELGK